MGYIRAEAAYYFVFTHQHYAYGIKEQLLKLEAFRCPSSQNFSLTSTYAEKLDEKFWYWDFA
jgi:hypothetical protein